ncbi:hypothetical protein ACHAWT_002068 [Skeletonema menzelii]
MSWINVKLLLLLASLSEIIFTCYAFTGRSLLQRIENTQATLAVEVGRIPGTAMPSEWAASGAKLGFTLEVGFTDNAEQITREMLAGDALMGNKPQTVIPLKQPSFISVSGSELIDVKPGAYGCQMQDRDSQQYALRFYLDFPNGARRNDVELPADRIYFLSRCWLTSSNDESMLALENARKEKKQILSTIELTDARLNKIRSSPPAGNLLGDIVQNVFNFRHIVKLVERKKKLQSQLKELERAYPLDSDKIINGPNDVSYAKEGVIAVKRSSKYLWVGRFKFTELS